MAIIVSITAPDLETPGMTATAWPSPINRLCELLRSLISLSTFLALFFSLFS